MLPVMSKNRLQVEVLPFSLYQIIGHLTFPILPQEGEGIVLMGFFLSVSTEYTIPSGSLAWLRPLHQVGHLECLLGRGIKVKVSGTWDTVTLDLAPRRASRQHTWHEMYRVLLQHVVVQ